MLQYLRGRVFYTNITIHSFYCIKITGAKKETSTLMISRDKQSGLFKGHYFQVNMQTCLPYKCELPNNPQHFLQTLKTYSSNTIDINTRKKKKWLSPFSQCKDLGKRTIRKQNLPLILCGSGHFIHFSISNCCILNTEPFAVHRKYLRFYYEENYMYLRARWFYPPKSYHFLIE